MKISFSRQNYHQNNLILNWLSKRREIHWIEKQATFEVFNKHARYVIQNGGRAQASSGASGQSSSSTSSTGTEGLLFDHSTPIWDAGLRGQGQVVAVSDTGLDADHCFFDDPTQDVPYDVVNWEHRKLVTYVTDMGDDDDEHDGHGTHVCGSVAGSLNPSTTGDCQGYQDYVGY